VLWKKGMQFTAAGGCPVDYIAYRSLEMGIYGFFRLYEREYAAQGGR
jgi:hypothetical protein